MMRDTFASIPLEKAVLWCACGVISNSTGDRCRVCDGIGGLMSLARVLDERETNTQTEIIEIDLNGKVN